MSPFFRKNFLRYQIDAETNRPWKLNLSTVVCELNQPISFEVSLRSKKPSHHQKSCVVHLPTMSCQIGPGLAGFFLNGLVWNFIRIKYTIWQCVLIIRVCFHTPSFEMSAIVVGPIWLKKSIILHYGWWSALGRLNLNGLEGCSHNVVSKSDSWTFSHLSAAEQGGLAPAKKDRETSKKGLDKMSPNGCKIPILAWTGNLACSPFS